MKFRRQKPEEVSVNLTPLIDVVFLLLIFFMVSTTFTSETHLAIDLPDAKGVASEAAPDGLEILISAEGLYSLNGVLLSDAQSLKHALSDRSRGDSQTPLTIAADAKTPHQAVISAMDVAGQLGFTQLKITTREIRH
ncbi:MAG: ExbD/TolR family protein [Pontibacterium sp.]